MLKLKDIFNIDISSKGGAKLYKKIMWKYNIPIKDIKEIKQEIVKCSSGNSTVKEGDLIYYTFNDSFNSIRNITDNITQIAVGRGESISSANVGNLNRFVDIQEVTIDKGDDYVSISIPNFIVVDMPAFVYKVGSDLKTAEDIIGNNSVTRITKEEYDNIFNM